MRFMTKIVTKTQPSEVQNLTKPLIDHTSPDCIMTSFMCNWLTVTECRYRVKIQNSKFLHTVSLPVVCLIFTRLQSRTVSKHRRTDNVLRSRCIAPLRRHASVHSDVTHETLQHHLFYVDSWTSYMTSGNTGDVAQFLYYSTDVFWPA